MNINTALILIQFFRVQTVYNVNPLPPLPVLDRAYITYFPSPRDSALLSCLRAPSKFPVSLMEPKRISPSYPTYALSKYQTSQIFVAHVQYIISVNLSLLIVFRVFTFCYLASMAST